MPALRENNRAAALRRTYLAYVSSINDARAAPSSSRILPHRGGGGKVVDPPPSRYNNADPAVVARARDMFSCLDIDPDKIERE